MEGLGRLFDIGLAFAPVDTQTAAITGKRISLENATGLTILLIKGAGTAADDPVLTVQQHTAYTGGSPGAFAHIDHYYLKGEAVLDNDESWVKVTQVASGTITDPGGAGTSAETQQLVAIEINPKKMDGYTHISLNVADTGSGGAQLASAVYILHGLAAGRAPELRGNLLNPGAANA